MVYLLHFQDNYCRARHYVGYTNDVQRRMKEHLSGQGNPLVRAVIESGIQVYLARLFQGNRQVEHQLKRQKNVKRFCPYCNGKEVKINYQGEENVKRCD
ncbi:MAG: GIY-YIG nuclease family protein [Syntrophomonadaceae bacterium]